MNDRDAIARLGQGAGADLDGANGLRQGRYELKFLIDPDKTQAIRAWALRRLRPDCHCSRPEQAEYDVTTLYLDTPARDILHRRTEVVRGKHRIRRYGVERALWLERKRKSKNLVRKRRSTIACDEWSQLWLNAQAMPVVEPGRPRNGHAAADRRAAVMSARNQSSSVSFSTAVWPDVSGQDAWSGAWFQRRIARLKLEPVALVGYRRLATADPSVPGGPRLTIDYNLRGVTAPAAWATADVWAGPDAGAAPHAWTPLLPEAALLELKFCDRLPPLFRLLMLEFGLQQSAYSKYQSAATLDVPR